MSVYHGDPRDFHVDPRNFEGGDPFPDDLGPPVAAPVPFHAIPSRRPLHADITALERRLAEEYANVEAMEYDVGGCRVTISRSADGFSVTLRRKP